MAMHAGTRIKYARQIQLTGPPWKLAIARSNEARGNCFIVGQTHLFLLWAPRASVVHREKTVLSPWWSPVDPVI